MENIFLQIRLKLRKLLRLDDAADETMVIDGIKASVEFRGAKLWVLMLAVFVASLGLNINSTAVIIGAMLISPLMGPIIGMGLGMAIYDFELLKKSVHNFLVATVFSVITATLYFLISPYSVAQSELLARTSPTIYDVLIAFCGGLAGIIALSSRGQRQGNVIPGVAIATALMPPLCTMGFGIATGSWQYMFGALYLFTINTIFIALATYFGAKFIMRFHKVTDANPVRYQHTRRIMLLIVILTIVPAVVLTMGMIRETYYAQHITQFVQREMHWPNTQVVTYRADYDTRTLNVVVIGQEVDSMQIVNAEMRLPDYGLDGVTLQVVQSASGVDEEALQSMFAANRATEAQHETLIAQQQMRIKELEQRLLPYESTSQMGKELMEEMQALWPNVSEVAVGRGMNARQDTTLVDAEAVIVVVEMSKSMRPDDESRMRSWIDARMDVECKTYIHYLVR